MDSATYSSRQPSEMRTDLNLILQMKKLRHSDLLKVILLLNDRIYNHCMTLTFQCENEGYLRERNSEGVKRQAG